MSDKDQTQVSTAADAGDAGYNKALKNRHIQMIAIGGSIGTGLFLGAGGRLAQGGPALPNNAYSSEDSPFTTFFSGIGVPHADDIMQIVVLTAALSSLNAGLYATGRTLRSMALVGEGPRFTSRLNKNHVPSGGIIITASLGPLGVLLNAFVPTKASNIVMDLAGIDIAGTWAMILISHLAFLRKVKRGEEQRPEFRMAGALHQLPGAALLHGGRRLQRDLRVGPLAPRALRCDRHPHGRRLVLRARARRQPDRRGRSFPPG